MFMKNHNMKESCFGVSIGGLKIPNRIKNDFQLALDLYDNKRTTVSRI